jgi:glycine hydroxymethyltransferase
MTQHSIDHPAAAIVPALGARSAEYLATVARGLVGLSASAMAERVERLVSTNDEWRARRCLNMNPAESLMSARSRRLLSSDIATRLTEGVPGAKMYPHGRQNDFIDEIEAMIIALVRQQFQADYVEWRPVSTSMANAAAFFSLLQPGDVLLSQDEDAGGNYAYNKSGPAGLPGAVIKPIPRRGEAFEIDLDALADAAERLKPKMIAFGGSNILFPYPVREMRAIADRVGAVLLYDAAHVGLLISSGDFQRPLREGAHIVTMSTHKIMGGPVGGLLLTNDASIADKVIRLTFPSLLQTRDLNKLAAFAVALCELQAFGPELASTMVVNAQTLARALQAEGFTLLAADRGYTRTHQLFLQLGDQAKRFETRCNDANILISDCMLTGDRAAARRTGSRIATHEVTRLGMKEAEMKEIASLMRRAFEGEASQAIASRVEQLRSAFQRNVYSFDEA